MAEHNQLGLKGEKLAAEFLQLKEYEILEKNYRHQRAEIDIIAKRGNVLIAVEVKTRSSSEFGNPQDFVKPRQIQQQVKAMNYYVESKDLDVEVRFDILAIVTNKTGNKIEHIQDAYLYF